ncbi:hypothetical protein QBC46DRAFT_390699 [Diplogelasinospora grovesii]|uniref:NmrA-like domain-containing protein n=1 Tax=Diplogelasinospora grovesii TaxID=303347 RepID=A0AAN6N3Q4_9PEZI|nr:hypothetical protein QBC46DRAFT_390699 [Diplogelasinospora grovesii]
MSSTSTPTVFVTSATGTQGTYLCSQLRSLGWSVHATTRSLTSPAAQHLISLGVNLSLGNWDDLAALTSAMKGCDMLFLNLLPAFTDISHERTQAASILSIAKSAGVKHAIYSSALMVNEPHKLTGITLSPDSLLGQALQSKAAIEQKLKEEFPNGWTILRGANFMQNFLAPKVAMYPGLVETNTWTTVLRPDTKLPLVDANDIAKFAVAAFQDPERFKGEEVKLAGDELTPDQIVAHLSDATGREMKMHYLADEEVEEQAKTSPFMTAQLAVRELWKFVSVEECKGRGIEMNTFREFLVREKELVKTTYP